MFISLPFLKSVGPSKGGALKLKKAVRRPLWRALLFGGGLLGLWLMVQGTGAEASSSAERSTDVERSHRPAVRTPGAASNKAEGPAKATPLLKKPAASKRTSSSEIAPSASHSIFSAGNLAALGLLLGGVGFAVYLRRRTPETPSSERAVELLAKTPLGQDRALRLVACGGQVLLLGVTDHQITVLERYDPDAFSAHDPGAPEDLEEPAEGAATGAAPFAFAGAGPSFTDVLSTVSDRYGRL